MDNCFVCGRTNKRHSNKYCSSKCQSTNRYQLYIKLWKKGLAKGSRGIVAKNISGHIRRYLVEKYGEKCMLCRWDKKHPVTKRVPLEIDHIDGNAENNQEKNLRLICPNCHSLCPNFRNLNKGNGRSWRTAKYIKGSQKNIISGRVQI